MKSEPWIHRLISKGIILSTHPEVFVPRKGFDEVQIITVELGNKTFDLKRSEQSLLLLLTTGRLQTEQ